MDFMKENVGGAAAAPGRDAAIDRAARMTACRRATDNAPAPLAGRRLPHGMRQALSSAVPDVAPCRLSCHLPEAAWEFAHYRTFRDEAARLAGVLGARACGRARH